MNLLCGAQEAHVNLVWHFLCLNVKDTTGSCVPDPLHPDQTSANSRTPLHAAAEMGHREIIQEFVRLYERLAVEHIRAGRPDDETPFLDFNVPDEAGFTPLHLAVLMANIPRLSNRIDVGASVTTVIYLMSHGADPFAMNKYAFPPARFGCQVQLPFCKPF